MARESGHVIRVDDVTWRFTAQFLERKTWLGSRIFTRSDLTSANLSRPLGSPPSYELCFRTGTVRFAVEHLSFRDMVVLKAFANQA